VGVGAKVFEGEFDPGSGRTLAACLTHASRAVQSSVIRRRASGDVGVCEADFGIELAADA